MLIPEPVAFEIAAAGRRRAAARRLAAVCVLALSGSTALALATAPVAPPPGGPASPGRAALDLAFRFASAIVSDAKDRARAQEDVVREYVAREAFAEALAAADRIEGWRQGTALADLAGALAAAGRDGEAADLVTRAERMQAATPGWQSARIRAHVAAALAALGETERAGTIATELAAQDRQYAGRPAAIAAVALARGGDAAGALQRLSRLDGDPDFEVSWWRTEGYLEVARRVGADAGLRDRALDAARRSADGIAGWKSAESLVRVAARQIEAGRTAAGREALLRAGEIARSLPPTLPVKGLLLAEVARGWGRTGETRRAWKLLREAEAPIAAAPVIDRPGLHAAVAAAAAAIGDRGTADRMYGRALVAAEGLRNARPRALAAVEICRVLGREEAPLEEATRSRLERLLAGLADPW